MIFVDFLCELSSFFDDLNVRIYDGFRFASAWILFGFLDW
jgi:hypothetical protein